MKLDTELQRIAKMARTAGYRVTKSRNGGGWAKLAIACGCAGHYIQKIEAKAFLRAKFCGVPAEKTLKDHETAKKSAATIQRRMNRPQQPVEWRPRVDPNSSDFLTSYDWRRVRMMALKKYGAKCQCCGATPADGAVMNVDHIKPRLAFPELALDVDNLQVLCHECNHGKGNWDQTDWRDHSPALRDLEESARDHMLGILRNR